MLLLLIVKGVDSLLNLFFLNFVFIDESSGWGNPRR